MLWNSISPRPGTSPYVAERGGANDEMHIVVYDSTGAITGKPNSLLEKFTYVSKANNGKTSSGSVNYYPTVIQDHPRIRNTESELRQYFVQLLFCSPNRALPSLGNHSCCR